jgi:hypothetical protein
MWCVVAPPTGPTTQPIWIFAPTWALIDKRATLQQQGGELSKATCLIGRQGDHAKCEAAAAEKIEEHLVAGESKEVWQCLKGW